MLGGKSVLNVDNRKLEIKRDTPQVHRGPGRELLRAFTVCERAQVWRENVRPFMALYTRRNTCEPLAVDRHPHNASRWSYHPSLPLE